LQAVSVGINFLRNTFPLAKETIRKGGSGSEGQQMDSKFDPRWLLKGSTLGPCTKPDFLKYISNLMRMKTRWVVDRQALKFVA
jgi:hypothetical protein